MAKGKGNKKIVFRRTGKKPEFPIFMLFFAVFKDVFIDPMVFLITIFPFTFPVGLLLGVMVGFAYTAVFTLWVFLVRQGALKTVAVKLLPIVIAAIVAQIPGIRMLIPEATLVVLIIHYLAKHHHRKHVIRFVAARA